MTIENKANYINSVAVGKMIPCFKCGALNEPDNKYCISCGTKINKCKNSETTSVFKQITETNFSEKNEDDNEKYVAFAQGLPEWSIEPPYAIVRRR